jgi:hypothetical protein
MKCINYQFCERDRVHGIDSKYCMDCGSWFKYGNGWNELTSTDECAVCMNLCKKKLLFPTKCGHSFCVREIFCYGMKIDLNVTVKSMP